MAKTLTFIFLLTAFMFLLLISSQVANPASSCTDAVNTVIRVTISINDHWLSTCLTAASKDELGKKLCTDVHKIYADSLTKSSGK